MGIQHSMISKISNEQVLTTAGESPLSNEVLRRQLLMFGRAAADPVSAPFRALAFKADSTEPAEISNRRRGRPFQSWSKHLQAPAQCFAGGGCEALFRKKSWSQEPDEIKHKI